MPGHEKSRSGWQICDSRHLCEDPWKRRSSWTARGPATPPDGQAARKDVLGLAEGVLRDVDSSKDALAALRAALAAEPEGKWQLQVCILASNSETQLANILRL